MADNNIAQEIQSISDKIRSQYAPQTQTGYNPDMFKPISTEKFRFEEISTSHPSEVYKTLNTGEQVAMFENYIPGTDNNERLAQSQSTGEKWANGVGKFFTKTGNAVLGGTAGTVYGVFDAIKSGSFDAVYDNSFTRTLDDWNTKMDYQLPNYYTKQEQEAGFGGSLTSANFWANDVLGAFSFTAGAIVSEGLWAAATGGASLAGTAARYGAKLGQVGRWGKAALGTEKAAEGLFKMKGFLGEIPKTFMVDGVNKGMAIGFGKAGSLLNNSRFLLTSSGYEAGVEAFHYKKEATENFYNNFKELNGRDPDASEVQEFTANLEDSANAVFAGNMAILAPSNAIMYGSMFGMKTPFKGLQKAANKSLFGVGVEETVEAGGKSAFKAIQATRAQKIFSGAYSAVKPIATESLWEEGGQSVVSKTAANWIESSYNPKYNGATIDLMDAMYTAMGETYGTKEGWKELGIGAIVGGGMSIAQGGGLPSDLREIQQQRKEQEQIANRHNTFTVAQDITARRIMMSGKMQDAVQRQKVAEGKGDFVQAQLAQQDSLIAEMEFRHEIGEDINDLASRYEIALNNVSEQEWKDAGIEDVDAHKEATINSYKGLLKSYKKNVAFAEAVYGGGVFAKTTVDSYLSKQALAYSLTKGESANQVMGSVLSDMSNIIGVENTRALNVQNQIKRLDRNTRDRINTRNKKISALQAQQQKLTEQLLKLQNAPKEIEGDRVTGNKLGDVTEKLLKIENEIATLTQEREEQATQLTEEINRQKGIDSNGISNFNVLADTISGEDLASISSKLKNIDNIINGYKGVNPQIYAELIDLSSQYKSAQESFLDYQAAAIGLTSGKVKIKTNKVGGWIGKAFNPKAPMDEFTEQYLNTILEQRREAELKLARDIAENRIGGAPEVVTEAETNEAITQERIDSIAEKVRKGITLSDRELQLRRQNEGVIEEKITQLNEELGAPIISATQPVTVDQQMTEVEALKKRLEDALKSRYRPLSYIGEDIDEMIKDKPTESEIEEYRELIKQGTGTLFDERRQELEQKLQNWKLLDSAVVGDQSLADILDLISLLETKVEQADTVTEITETEIPEITEENLGAGSPKADVYDIAQNTQSNVFVKKLDNGDLQFAHLNIGKLFNKIGGKLIIANPKGRVAETTDQNIEEYRVQEGSTFTIIPQGSTEGIVFKATIGGGITIKETNFYSNSQVLGMIIVNTGDKKWSWKDVYEWNGQEFVEKPSDYTDDNIQGDSYELQAGDEVEFFYDSEDSYNKRQFDLFNKEKITKEQLRDRVKIYLRKGGKNFATLKASRGTTPPSFLNIRRIAVEMALLETSSTFGTVKVSQLFKGSPKLNIDENGKVTNYNFTDVSAKEVVTTGYMENGNLVLTDKSLETKVDASFVNGVAKAKVNKKVPLVIIRKGKHFIAYPISMTKTPIPQGEQVEKILSKPNLSETEMVKEINKLLIDNGISPSAHNLVDLSDENKIELIKADLDNKMSFRTAAELADATYKKENLKVDATIQIDLEDLGRAISSPKVRIDLESTELFAPRDVISESKTEVEKTLSNLAVEVNSMLLAPNGYVDSKGNPREDAFTDVFSENEVIKRPVNNLQEKANKNILKEAFSKLNRNAKAFLGANKVAEIKANLEKLDFLENQLEVAEKINAKDITCND